ncbi:MAG: GNAT family N-acetyltransferase [Thermoguttaceae bacterium]|nr:GNAT family N-acetyltransferase [Thermoguttaceae bacterium]
MSVGSGSKENGVGAVDPEAFRARPNRLTTPRLELIPLTLDEFALYLSDVDALAQELRLAEPPSEPDAETRAALNWLFENALALDAASLCWSTLWTAVLRSENRVVGFLCFKGPPRPLFDFLKTALDFKLNLETVERNVAPTAVVGNARRAETARTADNERAETDETGALTAVVEIGYGVDEAFRGLGLATEAVGALVDWGRGREDVDAILAETLTANLPSRRVLEKCGFRRRGESSDALFWRVDVSRRADEKDGF